MTNASPWFPLHVHSQFSMRDGMTRVPELVSSAARDGRPALGLNDHGNMAGTVQLYKACKEYGLKAFPGFEGYLLVEDDFADSVKRYHFLINALNLQGYKALCRLSSLSHTRPRFSRFPRLTLSDLAHFSEQGHAENVSVTTGCFFGLTQQTLYNEGEKDARRTVEMLAKWFPHTLVEVQNHSIDHGDVTDDDLVAQLCSMAAKLGLPIIATQDSHYTYQRQRLAHALMKRMVYGGEDDEFPGDSFHLASVDWVKEHYTKRQWARVEEGAQLLLDLNTLEIPPLDTYTARVPKTVPHPADMLRRYVMKRLREHVGEMDLTKAKRYQDRAVEELDIIGAFADYILMVKEIVDWCREQGICIEARGSANGSLVCYLLGITQVDPLQWKLLFERFYSRDRIKPPDIDLDIEDGRRQEVIDHLRKKYPTVSIGTWAQLGMTMDPMTGIWTGSVFRTYQAYLRTVAMKEAEEELYAEAEEGEKVTKKSIEEAGRKQYAKAYGWIQNIDDVKRHDPKEHKALTEMSNMSIYKSYGQHAAGLILGTGEDFDIEDYVPTMLVASSDSTVTQYNMDDVEEFGLLKLDVLGQKTLTVMRVCQGLIGDRFGEEVDTTNFAWIPDDDPTALGLLREGRTDTGIFHFEGYTKAKGGRELGIRSTKDVILAQALYMPGATESGQKDHYLFYRQNAGQRDRIEYVHPIFESVLKETHGAVVFQEQPLAIMRAMGMSIANINLLFKVVKDSGKGAVGRNVERMAKLRKEFDYLCAKHGIDEVEKAWHQVTGFIAYGFNRAHATGYGIRAYRCAYLKAHYPHEFMTALLHVWVGGEKEKAYQREARHQGFRLLPSDVNLSDASWSIVRRPEGIRRGLVSVKGIGWSVAEAIAGNRPYKSVVDLAERVKPGGRALPGAKDYIENGEFSGALAALNDGGSLDSLLG